MASPVFLFSPLIVQNSTWMCKLDEAKCNMSWSILTFSFFWQLIFYANHFTIGHVLLYQYYSIVLRLLGNSSIFGVVFFVFKSLLGIEVQPKNFTNLQFWHESLRAMLEYWYIEHGLLKVAKMQLFEKVSLERCVVIVIVIPLLLSLKN